MGPTSLAVVHLAAEAVRSRGHGGAASYYLVRLLWHYLGWWTLLPVGALTALAAWLKSGEN